MAVPVCFIACFVVHAWFPINSPLLLCHCCADLINVFEVFLPQLLLYPNPTDPLNGEAAALMMREPQAYEQRVKGEQ
jgi:hypothetical protein